MGFLISSLSYYFGGHECGVYSFAMSRVTMIYKYLCQESNPRRATDACRHATGQCSGSVSFWMSRIRIRTSLFESRSRTGYFHQQANKN